jgi:ABC-type histidine transport system ATPase subunit
MFRMLLIIYKVYIKKTISKSTWLKQKTNKIIKKTLKTSLVIFIFKDWSHFTVLQNKKNKKTFKSYFKIFLKDN